MTHNNYMDDSITIIDDTVSPDAHQYTAYGKAVAGTRPNLKGHQISFYDQQPTKKVKSENSHGHNHSVSSVMTRLFSAGATRLGRTPVQVA